MRAAMVLIVLFGAISTSQAAPEPVELIGTAGGFRTYRDWQSYYWRDDFQFLLKEQSTGKTWRIISREPTPAYHWRMGPTATGLKVGWSKNPRVKVVGVSGIDRLPPTFHDLKLEDANIATVLVLYVETTDGKWQEYYVNNWFHKWSVRADPVIHSVYAGKKAPYDIYGFINGQTAPFSKEAQALIAKHPKARMFHGLIRATKANAFGYEIELLHLVGPDAGGNGVAYHGDAKMIPILDGKK
jgi:hypothetical protein